LDFAGIKPFDVAAKAAQTEVVIEPSSLKVPPGDYTFSVHGGYVSKYPSVPAPQKQMELAANAPARNTDSPKDVKDVKSAAPAASAAAVEAPKDIVDIVFSEPIRVRVKAASAK
jgi:hypothetical protein